MPSQPDFVVVQPPYLDHRDLLFLFDNFPDPGVDPEAAARRVIEHPSTLESLLESRFVFDALHDHQRLWLDISPRLFFNVLLRRVLPGPRTPLQRRTIHYLANLLGAFVSAERLVRIQPGERDSYHYLVDLMQAEVADESRNFLVHSHIGNYALFLSGVCASWVEHRHRVRGRPVTLNYYRQMGRTYFARAAGNRQAGEYGIEDILEHLAREFEYFRQGLQTLADRHLVH